jgi:hypothetical protein
MKKGKLLLGLGLFIVLMLSACGKDPIPSPTPTIPLSSMRTPVPTVNLSIPIDPTPATGNRKTSTEGMFSLLPPIGYSAEVQGPQIVLGDQTHAIVISFFGGTSDPQNPTAEEIVNDFTGAVFAKGNGNYEKGDPQNIVIDGVEGLLFNTSGTMYELPMTGQAVIVMPSNDRFLFGLGLAQTDIDKEKWANEGVIAFEGLMNSLEFTTAFSQMDCPISTDSTYGYTKENPIKVGGGAFGGPSRERMYLDNLLGANGETITYLRLGSESFEDTILDIFEIIVSGKKFILYIDEYSYNDLQAPIGFTCDTAFALDQP